MTINEKLRIMQAWGYIAIIENHADGVSVYVHTRTWGKGCHAMCEDRATAVDQVYFMVKNSIREAVRLVEISNAQLQ